MARLQRSPLARGRIHLCNWNRHLRDVAYHCTDEADHTFLPKRSFKAALSSVGSARCRFRFVFSSSSVFSRLASDTSMPPNLAFHL